MFKALKQDNGYSLLSVLLLITITSIIGIMFMGLTVNSLKFVTLNKNTVENKATAEMTIEEASAQVDKTLEDLNNEIRINNLLIDSIKTKLQTSLDNLSKFSLHPYILTHSTINSGADGMYTEKVMIKAQIGNTNKYITKTFTISTIADIFKYCVVSPGTVSLSGAPYIEGDAYVGGDLKTSNISTILQTSYPAIKGKLTVKGKYLGDGTIPFVPTDSTLNQYFSIAPAIRDTQPSVDSINVNALIAKKSTNLSVPAANKFTNLQIKNGEVRNFTNNVVITGNLTMEEGSQLNVTNGSITVAGTAQLKGTLNLSSDNYIYINGQTLISNLTLNGQVYINNAVDIQNNVNTNGTIYSSSNASVTNLANTSSGTLVLVSNGQINLFLNNALNDTPLELNAFFYSNDVLNIFGVLSNLKILGGVYGKSINLSAIKGNVWDNQNSLPPEKSRLSIIYKNDLILNPPKGIPTISNLSINNTDTVYDN